MSDVAPAADSTGAAGDEEEAVLSPPSPSPAETGSVEIRDTKLKKLSEDCARYRTERNTERQRVEAVTDELRQAKLHSAFLLAAVGKVNDLDAAWKLADRTGITVDETGEVTGLDTAVAATVERYPYLAPVEAEPAEPFQPQPVGASGREANGPRRTIPSVAPHATLVKKFPALKGR